MLSVTIRKESTEMISTLRDCGVQSVLLTGDNENSANSIAKQLGQHRTIAEASAVESPIRQETIGFPAHFFARAHNFKPPGRACQPEADSPMRT